MEFSEYQSMASATDQLPQRGGDGLLVPLLGMAGEVAALQTEYKKWLRDGSGHPFFKEHLREELGDVLWYVANLASKVDLTLDELAAQNLTKTRKRWLQQAHGGESALYDEPFPPGEQFPRTFQAIIRENLEDPKRKAVLQIDGVAVGDQLDDNSYEEDGYKFHDVFHLAHMTLLGWSPVLRKLLNSKRRSQPDVDNIEDGGRARVIDEGIVAFVFDYARRHNFLDGLRHVDYELLRTTSQLVSGLEVQAATQSDWERAILEGYRVWRKVKQNHGGEIVGDLVRRELIYVGPAPTMTSS